MKTFIKNRGGKNISVLIDEVEVAKGLAFISHGLGGFKDQEHISKISDGFNEAGYNTVRWDMRHTIGESEGDMKDVTISSYIEDLEDVVSWASTRSWYFEPFILCGHSLGGITITLYAEQHPEKVKSIALISTVVTGKLTAKSWPKRELESWKKKGIKEDPSHSKPGYIKKIRWGFIKELIKHDSLIEAYKLTMPILIVVGDKDNLTPLNQQQLLLSAAINSMNRKLTVIKNAGHNFRNQPALIELKETISSWAKKL